MQSLRGLFTDISQAEFGNKLFLIIRVIRVGQMDLKADTSAGLVLEYKIYKFFWNLSNVHLANFFVTLIR